MGLKALVITPTTGSSELVDAINSVLNQTYSDVEHLIVVDGFKFSERTSETLKQANIQVGGKLLRADIPFNTGGTGFYGHRVMAAFGHLINHDCVLFLDQDNWFENNHVETLVNEIKTLNVDWAYSLRKIFTPEKEFVCEDNCESLGRWPVWVNENAYLIDSSSYCFKVPFFRQICHLWDHGWGADRRFYTIVKEHLKHQTYSCSGQHTLNYRLGGNEGSVTGDFFIQGNQLMNEKYGGKFPWVSKF